MEKILSLFPNCDNTTGNLDKPNLQKSWPGRIDHQASAEFLFVEDVLKTSGAMASYEAEVRGESSRTL